MSNIVKRLWIASIFLAGTAVGCGSFAAQASEAAARNFQPQDAGTGTAAQASANQQKANTKTTHKKTQTLTGCLQKGDDANEYNFTAKDGGTWEIKSDSVKLDEHVGHTVKIVGVVSNATAHGMKEDAKEEMKEHGMDKHATERGHMTVTDLTIVRDTCQK